MQLLPVFCIADVPVNTINRLCEGVQEYFNEDNDEENVVQASDLMIVIDSKELSTSNTDSQDPSTDTTCPAAFVGCTLQEVHDRFIENVTQAGAINLMRHCFLVLDSQSAQEDTCIFVCTEDVPPEEIHSLRCTFNIAMANAISIDIQAEFCVDSLMGCYTMRTGVTMTKENLELAMHRGRYIERGYEVKVDEYWRDFINY